MYAMADDERQDDMLVWW